MQPTDSTVFRTALHPMSAAGGVVAAVVTMTVAVLIVRNNGLAGSSLITVLGVGTAVAALWLVGPLLRLRRSEIRVSATGVLVRVRLWGPARRASIEEIKGVDTALGVVGRQLGYGTVALLGAENTAATVRHVRDPAGLCEAIAAQQRRGRRLSDRNRVA